MNGGKDFKILQMKKVYVVGTVIAPPIKNNGNSKGGPRGGMWAKTAHGIPNPAPELGLTRNPRKGA